MGKTVRSNSSRALEIKAQKRSRSQLRALKGHSAAKTNFFGAYTHDTAPAALLRSIVTDGYVR